MHNLSQGHWQGLARRLKYLVIHCTATEDGREVTSDEIRRWHTLPPPSGRGWKQVGYSDMIHLDGRIENLVKYNDDEFVDPWEITNGVAGMNSVCRHIVYVGGMKNKKAANTMNVHQVYSLATYIYNFKKLHPDILVVGHRDLDPKKECPSFDVAKFLSEYNL